MHTTNTLLTALFVLLTACGGSYHVPDPVKPVVPPVVEPGGEEEGDKPGEPDPIVEGMLVADGVDEATYDLIERMGYEHECPDSSGTHSTEHFRHIHQSFDKSLGKNVFDFYLHIDSDDDRGKSNITDRQRNEIKTDAKSPASMVAQEGETLRMTWKFCLPAGMKTTTKFSHVHQLKGIDNKQGTADVSMPLITFTARTVGSGQQLQVIHTSRSSQGSKNTTLAKVDLSDFLGQWVSVTETVTFAQQGSYSVIITRISDGKQLIKLDAVPLDMWRDGTIGLRPKWGLYRNFGEGRSMAGQLRDEVLRFADFRIEKLK